MTFVTLKLNLLYKKWCFSLTTLITLQIIQLFEVFFFLLRIAVLLSVYESEKQACS